MSTTPVSIIVVSRDRPALLQRCLIALGQLTYPVFEIIVVACQSGVTAARQVQLDHDVTLSEFDIPNISQARNIGLDHARGEILAFVDDDAVPEPTWLMHLLMPFDDPSVAQAGGTTLGRNGISVQHGAARVDAFGVTHPLMVGSDLPTPVHREQDRLPRLHGTNMAIRRDVLARHGGFDERFRFYLDETDLTWRIAEGGGGTMFVPRAVVHHASGPSAMRRADRVPRSLFEIGASSAVFHRKHAPRSMWTQARDALITDRRNWLLRHMQAGALTPDDVTRLLKDLDHGYNDGFTREPRDRAVEQIGNTSAIATTGPTSRRDICLVATNRSRGDTLQKARRLVEGGDRVTVFDYDLSARFHRVRFTDDGYWLHTGGVFGREKRSDPLLQTGTRASRFSRTLHRLSGIRSLSALKCKT